jgi:hypothetical protein
VEFLDVAADRLAAASLLQWHDSTSPV